MKSNLAEVALISSSSSFFCPSSSDWTLQKHLSVRGITLYSPAAPRVCRRNIRDSSCVLQITPCFDVTFRLAETQRSFLSLKLHA